jgi:uncharacterized protein (DUF2236 family)
MASHLRYKRTVVSAERQEDYFRESAEIARRLGAQDIPQTPQEVADYLEAMRPQLRCDERTREVAEVLLSTRLPGRLSQPVGQVMMRAGIDLLPEWAQEMLGLSLTPLQRRTTRLMVHGVARVLRASVRNGAWHCAMRRMDVGVKIIRLAQLSGNQRLQAAIRPPLAERVIHRVKAATSARATQMACWISVKLSASTRTPAC